MPQSEVVLCHPVRTAIGSYNGSLKGTPATDLGAAVVRETLARSGLDPQRIDSVVMGNVIQAGNGQNPARQAALNGGLSEHVAALTVNKVCGSGLKAIMLAAQGIATGDIEIAVAERLQNRFIVSLAGDGVTVETRDARARKLAMQLVLDFFRSDA